MIGYRPNTNLSPGSSGEIGIDNQNAPSATQFIPLVVENDS
jgi:hypothetical protein